MSKLSFVLMIGSSFFLLLFPVPRTSMNSTCNWIVHFSIGIWGNTSGFSDNPIQDDTTAVRIPEHSYYQGKAGMEIVEISSLPILCLSNAS